MPELKKEFGKIEWVDLTVPNAVEIKNFYSKVVGWNSEEVSMGNYSDFSMISPTNNQAAAGICHKLETNAAFPSQWMIYITVLNIEESISQCIALGGKILLGPKEMTGHGKYCIIQDPANAVCALFEKY
jgi:hypothetical protein